MSILNNVERIGNFTSSKIVSLTKNGKAKDTFGAPFYTYVEETNFERELNRALGNEMNAPALKWGKLLEKRVFELLPIEYRLCSDETIEHRKIKCWAGSPDCTLGEDIVGDVKCPLTLKSFCTLVRPLILGLEGMDAINWIRENHSDGEKYFWQLVSNACITGAKKCQLIVYVPYRSELEAIRLLAREQPGNKLYSIINSDDGELPYLQDGGYYKNLNIIEFPVTEFDKNFLTQRVEAAETMLIKRPDCYTTLIQ